MREYLREPINRRLKVHALEMPMGKVRIVFSELGEISGALGVTTLVLNRIFRPAGFALSEGGKNEIV